jgi:transposase
MSKIRYDKNYKIEVIRRACEKGQNVPEISKELGIHENTIYKWIAEFKKDETNAFPGSGKLKPEDEELRRLKKRQGDGSFGAFPIASFLTLSLLTSKTLAIYLCEQFEIFNNSLIKSVI